MINNDCINKRTNQLKRKFNRVIDAITYAQKNLSYTPNVYRCPICGSFHIGGKASHFDTVEKIHSMAFSTDTTPNYPA